MKITIDYFLKNHHDANKNSPGFIRHVEIDDDDIIELAKQKAREEYSRFDDYENHGWTIDKILID